MFTGIITEVGKVKRVRRTGPSAVLEVMCRKAGDPLSPGESVAVNGVCLSVTGRRSGLLFDVVGNTLEKTNLKRLKTGDPVNLESALKIGDTLSGHMVSGHVDCERRLKNGKKTAKGWIMDISIFPGDRRHLVRKGSIAVDGVSLTVGELTVNRLRIFLIPHTLENTILKLKKTGDYVNLEFDIMAKYAEKRNSGNMITEDMLREKGFI
ncbi:MAG: riboflavin synthase [Candidatus Omnitrophota bacterium]|nr:riboflavin synthase [Candidatus Omnitrophota bacterium]